MSAQCPLAGSRAVEGDVNEVRTALRAIDQSVPCSVLTQPQHRQCKTGQGIYGIAAMGLGTGDGYVVSDNGELNGGCYCVTLVAYLYVSI